jgi:CheY-like chemotaxis protein
MSATVLIVDDQEIGRITLEGFLLPLGYALYFAASGTETLALLPELRPDVILLDVMMPKMDGFEVCRRIRADSRWRDIPIILVTALDDRASKIKGLEVGADDFISKPVDWAELRARVRTTVELGWIRRQLHERARFEWAVNQSSDGFVWLDEGGRIAGANPVAQRWLGIDPKSGHPFLAGLSGKFVSQPKVTWTELAGKDEDVILTLVRPETDHARSLWLQVTLTPMPVVDEASGAWMVHLQDVTALQARMLQSATVLAFVSHKLNSPLTSLSAALEMLAMRIGEVEMLQELLRMANKSLASLEATTAQLLYLMEEFREPMDQSDGALLLEDLDAVVEHVCQQLALSSDQCSYTRTVSRLPPFRPAVIERILYLLLDNAIKFHPRRAPQVRITMNDEGQDSVRLEVEDDGPGIPSELWTRVWQPLYQIDREGAGQIAGIGVGLSLVANIVWRVGGRCWIENGDAGGARICIIAPARQTQSQ